MNKNSLYSQGPDSAKPFSQPKMQKGTIQESILVDGHVDLPFYMMNHAKDSSLSDLDKGPFTLNKARQTGVRLFCSALYCEDSFNGDASFKRFQEILSYTLEHFDQVEIIKNNLNLTQLIKNADTLATILLLENADSLAGNLPYIEQLKGTGIQIVGLTHAGKNRLGDGNAVLYPHGLTKEGMEVIRSLEENGLIIDVAHLHPKCFWQLLDLFEGPIISSHTGVREAFDIPRNINMDQGRAIIERGGVIGLTFNPEMLSPEGRAGIEQVFAHLDTFVQTLGPDGIGVGSDFCGYDRVTEALEDITGITHLTEIMLAHGYGEEGVNKIMGLNWLRVYENNFTLAP
jgi:membrane dipeptidase